MATQATPVLRKEYLDMIPEFKGEPLALNRFITICDRIVAKFYVASNIEDFQNEYLFSTILSKIKSPASELIANANSYAWPDVRQVLLTSYSDKRDCFTLNLEMTELKQGHNESPFKFYDRIQSLLNLQVAYFLNKEVTAKANVLIEYTRRLALRVLLRGLQEPVGSLMRTKNPITLEEAISMLTNDFQFKATNQSQVNHKKPFVPNRPNQSQPSYKSNFPVKQNWQNNQNYYKPAHFDNNGNNNNRFYKQPHNNQSQSNQPTPMSISTTNTNVADRRNQRLNQITGKPAQEDSCEDNIVAAMHGLNYNEDPNNVVSNNESDPFLEEGDPENGFT